MLDPAAGSVTSVLVLVALVMCVLFYLGLLCLQLRPRTWQELSWETMYAGICILIIMIVSFSMPWYDDGVEDHKSHEKVWLRLSFEFKAFSSGATNSSAAMVNFGHFPMFGTK